MVVVGWIDLFFIARWTREINETLEEKVTSNNVLSEANSNENKHKKNRKETSKEFHASQPNSEDNKLSNQNIKQSISLSNNEKKCSKHSFYSEEDNIMGKYSHIVTAQHIIDSIDKYKNHNQPSRYDNFEITVSISTEDSQFCEDSIQYKDRYIKTAREVPLMAYWTSFQTLSKDQLMWYLHWRGEMLNQRYIDVDMSYIILFVYELMNYSFNQNAAFNVSVIVNLYENYKDREPKLENYLPRWIADMLYELGEIELAKEWDQHDEGETPKLYAALEEELPLDKISMTTWRKYLKNHRQTAYFTENRSRIYNVFKNGLTALESEKKELLEHWFKVVDSRKIRYLFQSAVMFRSVEPIHVPTINIIPTDSSKETITAMLKFSENVSRKINGVRHQVKVNEDDLPTEFKEHLESRYLDKASTQEKPIKKADDSMQSNKKKSIERFSVVAEERATKGSDIPPEPKDQTNELDSTSYEFDEKLIQDISKGMDEVVGLFEDGTDDTKTEERSNTKVRSEYISNEEPTSEKAGERNPLGSISFGNHKEEDYDSFINSLNKPEINFILRFKDSLIMEEDKAQQILKEQGVMLSVFLATINERSNMYLGEILLGTDDGVIEYDEEFDDIFSYLEELVTDED